VGGKKRIPNNISSKSTNYPKTLRVEEIPPLPPLLDDNNTKAADEKRKGKRSKFFMAIVAILLLSVGASSLLYASSSLPNSTITQVRFIIVTTSTSHSSMAGNNDINQSASAASVVEFNASVSIQYRAGGLLKIGPLPFHHPKSAFTITSVRSVTAGFEVTSTTPQLPLQINPESDISLIVVLKTPGTSYSGPLSLVISSTD
jgi:hypothetical protein